MQISNVFGLITGNSLRVHFNDARKICERLSSGLQINHSADSPSDMAISTGMRAVIGGMSMAIQNTQDGLAMLQTADGAAGEIGDLLQRGRDLSVRAANDATLTDDDVQSIQNEIQSIIDEVDRSANTATYNTKALLTGGTGLVDTYDVQADWQAGIYDPAELETNLFPGRIQLQADWTQHPEFNQTMADTNEYRLNVYLNSAVDNGNGTYTANLMVDARVATGDPACNYTGTINLGAGSSTVACTGGPTLVDNLNGTYDFDINATDTNSNCFFIQFTTSDISNFSFRLTGNTSGMATKLYYGNQQIANAATFLPVVNTWTAYVPTATYTTNVFDTEQSYGSTGRFNSLTGMPAGSNIQIELFQSDNPTGPWTSAGVFTPNASFTYTHRYVYTTTTLTRGPVATRTPSVSSLSVDIDENRELQIGTETERTSRYIIPPWDARSAALGISAADVTAGNEIGTFNDAIDSLSSIRGEIGKIEKTLNHVLNDLFKVKNNIIAANSRIEDTDYAREFVEMTRANIIGQSATAITAQGDASANGVINLFNDTGVGNGSVKTPEELVSGA
jgi:flagellin